MSKVNSKTTEKSNFGNDQNKSDSDDDWGLEILIKSTPKKRKPLIINEKDKKIIEEVEKDIEEALEEKAAKSNLSHMTVKSILKHVFTDEHVLALVKQKEGCEQVEGIIPYEPKITRSKAKEMLSNSTISKIQWQDPAQPSEDVQALLTEELQEDSSGDEYVPGEECEENTSFISSLNNSLTTNRSFIENEVFGVLTPQNQTEVLVEEDATIALRTRSKLSLNQTSVEKIEQSFVPPDITLDMYDMDCTDTYWTEFLKSFTEPLEEVVKNTEDEDLDPEYNILADEEFNDIDREELRIDKAVKVTRKEVNELMSELFEFVNVYTKRQEEIDSKFQSILNSSCEGGQVGQNHCLNETGGIDEVNEMANSDVTTKEEQNMKLEDPFSEHQLLLLDQQMQQHIQMLTQNFLLSFEHPCYSDFASYMKEYVLNLKFLSKSTENSKFQCKTLENALNLIEKWEMLFIENDERATKTIAHFERVLKESLQLHNKKQHYYLPFPPLILQTIVDSEVFSYPSLLPRIPYKHPWIFKDDVPPFSQSELHLIAMGLEQFTRYHAQLQENSTRKKVLSMKKVSEFISSYMLPARQPIQIYRQIVKKNLTDLDNPITYYYQYDKVPPTVHEVDPQILHKAVPPRERPAHLLPKQWRNYIYPEWTYENCGLNISIPGQEFFNIQPKGAPPVNVKKELDLLTELKRAKLLNTSLAERNRRNAAIRRKFILHFRNTVSYSKYFSLRKRIELLDESDMLPNMPCLSGSNDSQNATQKTILDTGEEPSAEEFTHNSGELLDVECENGVELNKGTEKIEETSVKDNAEEIKNLVNASSTIRNVREKKELTSLADKKKAKKRKEYMASMAMIAPPDPVTEKERREQFAQAYFEKLKDTLDVIDYDHVSRVFRPACTKKDDAVELYKKLLPILSPKYKDLADELLLFLNAEQANAVGKLIPFFIMNHMAKFVQNLKIYFKDQPTQLRKIYRTLTELNDGTNVTLEKAKSVMLPLLRGNSLLCDGFLQIFLEESPPSTLMNGAWEVIDVNKEMGALDDEAVFESITVSDVDDSVCTCDCHKIDEQQPLKQHCIQCGLRFVQGKVYCQTAKGLKPVQISFPQDADTDHNARLGTQNKIKRVDHGTPKRLSSPSKEPPDENRLINTESEEDDKRRNLRTCRSKKSKTTVKKDSSAPKSKCSAVKSLKLESPKKPSNKTTPSKRNRTKSLKLNEKEILKNEDKLDAEAISKAGNSAGQIKRLASDIDWKNLPSPEYLEVNSSDNDSSQDDELSVIKETNSGKNEASCDMWTRDEDKIILKTFQQKSDEEAIQLIAQQLKNRSVDEIRTRFERLMALLQEMESS